MRLLPEPRPRLVMRAALSVREEREIQRAQELTEAMAKVWRAVERYLRSPYKA